MREERKSGPAAWFALTREERWLVAGIAGLVLLGLTARHLHLRHRMPVEVPPPAPSALEDTP